MTITIDELITLLKGQRTLKQVIARESAIQRHITKVGGTPIIEGNTAHFFFDIDKKEDIWVIGDWNNWRAGIDKLERIHPKSSLYHLAKHFPADARLSYRIIVGNGDSINDPNNPHTWQEVFGNNTYFTMPAYEGTSYLSEPSHELSRGKIREFVVRSGRGLDFSRTVYLYIPPALKKSRKYHFLYVHDGEEALRIGKFANVLDNLRNQERGIPGMIVVFIPPVDRHVEYMMNEQFAKWCATTLVKEVEKHLGVQSNAKMRCMQGASLGGLQAAYTGLLHSNVFGNIACQSPSFWYEDQAIIKLYAKSKRLPVRFFLHTGTIHDALTESRSMLEVLKAKGYDVMYLETNESHNWANWSVRYEKTVKWLITK